MNPADQMRTDADARVSAWQTLTADEWAELRHLADSGPVIRDLDSGGAFLTVNGVDRWFPSRRDALAELAARVLT